MAINKKLIHFKNKQTFEQEVAKGNILNTSIVFIQDSKEIYTHGTLYDGKSVDLINDYVLREELSDIATTGNYNDLSNKPIIPEAVTENTVDGWGFTKNTGTITGITMNGASKGTSGVVNLGTVLTSHQDISGKQDKLVSGTNIKTINGESLLGSGNVEIDTNLSTPMVNHGTSDTTFTLTPNVLHVWDVIRSLNITLDDEIEGVANEFMFQFKTGDTPPTITLPDRIKWANNETPVFDSFEIVQISILNGLGTVVQGNILKKNYAKLTYSKKSNQLVLEFDYPVASDITCEVIFENGFKQPFTVSEGEYLGFANNILTIGGIWGIIMLFSHTSDDVYEYRSASTEVFIDYYE